MPSVTGSKESAGLWRDEGAEWRSRVELESDLDEIRDDMGKVGEYLFAWSPAAHHKLWADQIQKLIHRELTFDDGRPCKRLLLVAPPASAKTNWGGIVTPSYYVGNNPDHHILYLSSAQEQSRKSSLAVRDTVATNDRYKLLYPEVKPDRAKGWAAHRWFVRRPDHPGDKDPTMLAAGVGSQVVLGSRADFIIFDDINTQENTATLYRRDKVKEWVRQTAFSRETADAVQLALMTRWHTDDIAHFFEEEGGYKVIVMPALGYWDEEGLEGEALWPEVYDRDFYIEKRRDSGETGFARMYQGRPVPEGGAIFREHYWLPYYKPYVHPEVVADFKAAAIEPRPPYSHIMTEEGRLHLTQRVLTVDTAYKENDDADYTVMALWGVAMDRQAYLLAMYRAQVDSNLIYDHFIAMAKLHKPDISVIEDRSSGIQLIQDVQRKTSMAIIAVSSSTAKEERARSQSHVIAGAFHLPDPEGFYVTDEDGIKHQHWLGSPVDDYLLTTDKQVTDFIQEHADFPAGRNDDIVDTTVFAAEHLRPLLTWYLEEEGDLVDRLPDMAGMATGQSVPGEYATGPIPVEAMGSFGPEKRGGLGDMGYHGLDDLR